MLTLLLALYLVGLYPTFRCARAAGWAGFWTRQATRLSGIQWGWVMRHWWLAVGCFEVGALVEALCWPVWVLYRVWLLAPLFCEWAREGRRALRFVDTEVLHERPQLAGALLRRNEVPNPAFAVVECNCVDCQTERLSRHIAKRLSELLRSDRDEVWNAGFEEMTDLCAELDRLEHKAGQDYQKK